MLGKQENSFLREFLDQLQRVAVSGIGVHFQLRNDFARDDFAQGRGAYDAPTRARLATDSIASTILE